MNFDAIISWLTHANWVFLAIWIALLAAGVRACFSTPSPKNDLPPRSQPFTQGD